MSDELHENPAAYTAPEPLPDELVQSFTITARLRPNGRDENGNMPSPVMEYKPEGDKITPDDCLSLALAGAQWANAQRVRIMDKLHRQMQAEMAERAKSRVIRLGLEGKV